ncbi:MAG: hypothetical protein U0942_16340 [Parvibaculum sp.]|uniref:hypothetical protein n=1 Tax=Parvibaculum sp. TaxID=2024848 RepID=UPI002ABA59C1|nr:hypothetical protein [Parvibaculum sp.]MDZ4382902.1 hypothetical protein [Parvibaculum sp.]
MMKRLHIFPGLLLALAIPAAAPAETWLAGSAAPRIVEISEDDCRRIAPYLPGGADYVPGVAADGSAVAPAGIDGGYRYGLRPFYEFDVTLDPLAGLNPAFGSTTEMSVARIVIDTGTGHATIDGEDVSGVDRALAEACAGLHHKPVK